MEWTGLNELREKFLAYFESKGHTRLASFPLVPVNDNSLLLINSGMAPMKKYFTGELTPPSKRMTTCQKCIRTPDIERVGKTARHGTYFEMLGNFSFGDYFKKDAAAWAWEFSTAVMKLPVDRLWVSIYEQDDETFSIWTDEIGVDPARIVRLGKADNFWEHGTGPCGPCSELYFDRGEQFGCDSPECGVGCDCDRYVEFWNLVFTQFDSDGQGNYTPLEHPNIDTGMGLERLACIMQGVTNLFEVDTVQNIMQHISRIAGVRYGEDEKTDISLRIITDHIRSTVFMVGDGVMPSNEGRGYVLRRLLRRAARQGRLLGLRDPFLADVCDTVIAENRVAYPELHSRQEFIKTVIFTEEEAFGKTIDQGLALLGSMVDQLKERVLSGESAFKLYDTFGFPFDLTKDILEERGIEVDAEAFERLMKEQRDRARSSRKADTGEAWAGGDSLVGDVPKSRFTGYTEYETDAAILAIVTDGERAESASSGEAVITLDATPFYAESGGQVGDTGELLIGDTRFIVRNTTRTGDGVVLHTGTVEGGEFGVGEPVRAKVDAERRQAIMRNHTAAHLLQASLRKVLGPHVEQAGQLVSERTMRFDFTHFKALAPDEIMQIETEINRVILAGLPVSVREMPIDEARAIGAMALFGEKYGDVVRVVQVENISIELCGGTHVDNTAKIGLFKIVSENSVAAGVRRIEAVTGLGVMQYIARHQTLLTAAANVFKIGNIEEIARRASQIADDLKARDKRIEELTAAIAKNEAQGLFAGAKMVKDVRVVAAMIPETSPNALRALCDQAKAEFPNMVAVVASEFEGKVTLAAACGKEAVAKGAHAGNLVREITKITGGGGGGRPDSAMAGIKDTTKLQDAFGAIEGIVSGMLG